MDFDYMEFITPGTIALLGILLFWLINTLGKRFLSKTDIEALQEIASIAVKAAEQAVFMGRLKSHERFSYAIEIVQTELESRGIKIDVTFIGITIEAIVLGLEKSNLK